jgi:hypothetical protein
MLLFWGMMAAVGAAQDPAGDWRRSTIEDAVMADYTTEYVLYLAEPLSSTTPALTWNRTNTTAVTVNRNPDAQGWDLLLIEYNTSTFDDDDVDESLAAYYAAGYAEGYLTFDTLWSSYRNNIADVLRNTTPNAPLDNFMSTNFNYLRTYPTHTPFGLQLARLMKLIEGMAAGWEAQYVELAPSARSLIFEVLDFYKMFIVNVSPGLDTIFRKFANTTNVSSSSTGMAAGAASTPSAQTIPSSNDRCSVLIKLTDKDVLFGHATWYNYNTMIRQFKTYAFGDSVVRMSGYPGLIASTDDFALTSNNLAVLETTNGFINKSLYDQVRPTAVPETFRFMIACFLATTAREWMELFAMSNSGTYNNQYMVLDVAAARAAFAAGQPLRKGTFYVGEQVPGLIIYHDQTNLLNEQRYWPSYNIPFYPEIYEAAGYPVLAQGSYNLFVYDTAPRAVLFRRMQGLITNESSLFYLLRYNNYQHDPASDVPWCQQHGGPYACTDSQSRLAVFAIASRADLCPEETPGHGLPAEASAETQTHRSLYGAIDVKVTSGRWMLENDFRVAMQTGPTFVQQPVFDHDKFIAANPTMANEPWHGLPSLFDFAPMFVGAPLNVTGPPVPLAGQYWGMKITVICFSVALGVGILVATLCVVRRRGGLHAPRRSGSRGESEYRPIDA